MDYSEVYEKVASQVKQIVVLNQNAEVLSFGTAFVVGDGTLLLTCSHCINMSNGQRLALLEYDKLIDIPLDVIVDDQQNDFALLKTTENLGKGLNVIDSKDIKVGNEIFTIGFPYQLITKRTLTAGYVASLYDNSIRINNSVNNGNSGGPLFDKEGNVIGIVNAKMGSLSKFLQKVSQKSTNGVFVNFGGIDPIGTMKQMIVEMQQNLNLGIGYAISTNFIKNKNTEIAKIIK